MKKVDAESFGPPLKFQLNTKIQLNAARVSTIFPFLMTMIIHGSINQVWTVTLLCNVVSLLIVKDTTNETETFLKIVK